MTDIIFRRASAADYPDPRLPKGQCAERNHAQIQNSKFKIQK